MTTSTFAFLDLSTPDLLIILAIVLILFGAKKLPEVSKSLGKSVRELRKGLDSDDQTDTKETSKKETSQE